jgi:hypothetical protein
MVNTCGQERIVSTQLNLRDMTEKYCCFSYD